MRRLAHGAREVGRNGYPREIVVTERGMAYMTGYKYLISTLSRYIALAIAQTPRRERGIDTDFVLLVQHLGELIVRQTKAPGVVVVGGSIRDPIRPIRQRKKVRL